MSFIPVIKSEFSAS